MNNIANDTVRAGRAVASWLFPPVGVITYAMIKEVKPKAAKNYLIISAVGVAMMILGAVISKMNKPKNDE